MLNIPMMNHICVKPLLPTPLRTTTFENIVAKEEIAHKGSRKASGCVYDYISHMRDPDLTERMHTLIRIFPGHKGRFSCVVTLIYLCS